MSPLSPRIPGPYRTPALRSAVAGSWALLVGVGLMMAGNGLQSTLIGVRSTLESFDTRAIGVMTACYFAGFLVGSRMAFRALKTVGHIRVFAALASGASAVSLLYALFVDIVAWSVLRFLSGLCMAGLFVVAESWLNDETPNETRGVFLSGYLVVGLIGEIVGQALLNAAPPTGLHLFLIASVLISISLLPITMSAKSVPPVTESEPVSLGDLWSVVPTGVVALVLSGTNKAALTGLVAVHAVLGGLGPSRISILIATMSVGGLLAQVPFGVLSDRVSRGTVMIGTTLAASVVAVFLARTDLGQPVALPMIFVLGVMAFPLYGLGAAQANDRISSEQRVGAAMVMTAASGVGAVVGPLIASFAMSQIPGGLFYSVAATNGAFALYLAVHTLTQEPSIEAAFPRLRVAGLADSKDEHV